MKNNILGLRTTIYHVGDIHATKTWYAEVFETQPYFILTSLFMWDLILTDMSLGCSRKKTL